MASTQRNQTDAGRAARALARSGLTTLRVPKDLDVLTQLGLPDGRRGVRMLVRLGLLRQVARGVYEVRDPTGVSRSTFELLLASRVADVAHLATGWWALAVAGLTNQDVREVVVLTPANRRDLEVAGRRAHVVHVDDIVFKGGAARTSGMQTLPGRAWASSCAVTVPPAPRTDNAYSLDVDRVEFSCADIQGTLDVELSST